MIRTSCGTLSSIRRRSAFSTAVASSASALVIPRGRLDPEPDESGSDDIDDRGGVPIWPAGTWTALWAVVG